MLLNDLRTLCSWMSCLARRHLIQEINLLEQLQLSFPFTLNNVSPLGFLFFPIPQQWNSDFPIFLRNISNGNEYLCQDMLILFTVTVTLPLHPEHNPRGRGPCCYHSPASSPLLLRSCWHATGPELRRMWRAAGRRLSTAIRGSCGLQGCETTSSRSKAPRLSFYRH